MPTYNHGAFISDAIKSVINQTFSQWELIVIDNYSIDETESIVRSFNDDRIIYQKFHNDGIIAASRNRALSLAKGKYIAFLDSDDVWYPSKIDKQIKAFKYNTKMVICGTNEEWFPIGPGRYLNILFPLRLSYSQQLLKNQISSSTVMIRYETYKKVGGMDENREIVTIEDYDYWLKILKETPGFALILPQVLSRYRVHSGMNSQVFDPDEPLKNFQKTLKVISKHEIDCPVNYEKLIELRRKIAGYQCTKNQFYSGKLSFSRFIFNTGIPTTEKMKAAAKWLIIKRKKHGKGAR
jgi:glycosyltransferase involved in cell wall biosynthesis